MIPDMELEELIGPLPAAVPVTDGAAAPINRYRWSPVSDGNLDDLPERLCPKENCPTCGAVWADYVSVGWLPPIKKYWAGTFYRNHWEVIAEATGGSDIFAVRLRCFSGHRVDFDGINLWPLPAATWAAMMMGPWAGVGAIGALAYFWDMRR